MGIRIEDSVCVGEEAPLVLSVEAAKEVSALVDPWNCNDSREGNSSLTVNRLSTSKLLVRVTLNRVLL